MAKLQPFGCMCACVYVYVCVWVCERVCCVFMWTVQRNLDFRRNLKKAREFQRKMCFTAPDVSGEKFFCSLFYFWFSVGAKKKTTQALKTKVRLFVFCKRKGSTTKNCGYKKLMWCVHIVFRCAISKPTKNEHLTIFRTKLTYVVWCVFKRLLRFVSSHVISIALLCNFDSKVIASKASSKQARLQMLP